MLMSALVCATSGIPISQQRITCRTAASPLSKNVVPRTGPAARGPPGCISTYAGRPCSISRPGVVVTTAAEGPNGGGAAGKSSNMDSRRVPKTGKPSSSSENCTRGSAADSDNNRPAAGAARTRSQATGHHFQRPPKQSKPGRNALDINEDLKLCTSVTQLQQLVQQDGPAMTYVNLAAAIVTLQRILSKSTPQQQQQVVQTAGDLFTQLWQLQQPKLPQCKARQLANMIYAVSLLPTPWQQQYQWVVTKHLLPAFMQQLSSAAPQAVSNVLYGAAASGQHLPRQSTELLINQLVAVLSNSNTHDIANALWAVASLQQQVQPTQLQQFLDAFCAVAHTAKPQEIANTLWAVAAIKQQAEHGQLEQLLGALVMQLNAAVPQNVSNTLSACAGLRYLPKHLLTAPALLAKLAAADPQALANTAWACGQLGYRNEQLMSGLLHRFLGFVDTSTSQFESSGVTAQTLTNLCWSLAVLDMQHHASAVLTLVQASKPLWASMAPEELSQLYQVHMWLIDHSLATGQGLAGVLTTQQLQQCQSTWQGQLERTAKTESGSFHQSVFTALQRIPRKWLVPPAMEQVSLGFDGQPDGAALIDITARTADGVWLAVEADGPTHFRRPDGGLMGATLYRNRALAVRGYVLISVPYYEWNIQQSGKLKQQYLLDKVTAALQQAAVNRLRLQDTDVAPPPCRR